MKLTAQTVDRLQPSDRRQEIPDKLCTGLYLTIQPTGRKGWQVRYRHGGRHRRMTLGAYPVLTLAAARQRAREVLAAAGEGRDPAEEVRAAKAPKPADDRNKVRVLVEQFDRRHLSNLRSGAHVRQSMERYIVSAWGERDIREIGRRDVIDLLDSIVDLGRLTTANRVRAHLSSFFNWCIERDIIEISPVHGIKARAKEVVRERVLSDDEIRWLWQAADAAGYPFGPLAKLLLLTGQRRGEVANMTRDEIEDDNWHLPAERVKNGRAHDVPLSGVALEVIETMPRIGDRFLFTTTGLSPISGFGRARGNMIKAMAELATEERGEPIEIANWTWHDLRRTCATGLARLGIPVRTTEAVLNHISGTGGGIVAVYQRHDYAEEKRQALEAWGRYVTELVEGKPANVVRLAEAR